jgi:hypothetical protein
MAKKITPDVSHDNGKIDQFETPTTEINTWMKPSQY